MPSILNLLSQFGDFLTVVLGFSLIIVLHELGHFFAARWAKIRVLAFAVGFGPALVSYRRGLGWRRGSSDAEYNEAKKAWTEGIGKVNPADLSTTEYRLNILPFGGYVKMLGQDDTNPAFVSDEPDSYQNCKTWKRMIVISAGVAANIVTAAILFVAVFMLGLRTEPAKVGAIEPGSPAATTMASNAAALGFTVPGLKPGDSIVGINGQKPLSFNDVMLAPMIAHKGSSIAFDIERPGVKGILRFAIVPQVEPTQKVQYIGVSPAASNQLRDVQDPGLRAKFEAILAESGAPGVEPGMTLVSVDGKPVTSVYPLTEAIDAAGGKPVPVRFRGDAGREVAANILAQPRLQHDTVQIDERDAREVSHVLGLLPAMRVKDLDQDSPGERAGLKAGDVFVQIGAVEWPSIPAGVREVRAHAGGRVKLVVARKDTAGAWNEVDLGDVKVNGKGQIGFNLGDSAEVGAWVAGGAAVPSASANLPKLAPGTRIVAVNGHPVSSLTDVRMALAALVAEKQAEASLTVELPLKTHSGQKPTETASWSLTHLDQQALAFSAWQPALDAVLFQPEQFKLQAASPIGAIGMGLRETERVMTTTYLTFARLFQGSVKVEHLRGPVGIAQVGTILAERGFVWLLFFMALISVNLAVVNFLPIPIADGGHFVFLLYEQITGKPVSVAVQNVASIAGLLLLATMFLIVTYHDIVRLFVG